MRQCTQMTNFLCISVCRLPYLLNEVWIHEQVQLLLRPVQQGGELLWQLGNVAADQGALAPLPFVQEHQRHLHKPGTGRPSCHLLPASCHVPAEVFCTAMMQPWWKITCLMLHSDQHSLTKTGR